MAEPQTESIFDRLLDEAAETPADAAARADIVAGRLVPHEDVVKWLESWGKPDELPCPLPPTA
jgi:predicted transcriptional regulator